MGAKAITLVGALAIAFVFEILGAFLAGRGVVDTIKGGIIHPGTISNSSVVIEIMLASLLSAVFGTLKQDFASTGYTAQAALMTAKLQLDKEKADDARATLTWAVANAKGEAYRDLARLRLAALQMDAKQYDEAAKTLDGVKSADFAPLAADRRGDLALLQNKPDVAKTEFKKAYDGMDKQLDYRRLLEVKLASLGVAVGGDAAAAGAAQ